MKKFITINFAHCQIQLAYNSEKHVVRIVCETYEIAAKYLAKIIVDKKIGAVDTVVYSETLDSKVLALIRGVHLRKFLRYGDRDVTVNKKKSFSELAEVKPST